MHSLGHDILKARREGLSRYMMHLLEYIPICFAAELENVLKHNCDVSDTVLYQMYQSTTKIFDRISIDML